MTRRRAAAAWLCAAAILASVAAGALLRGLFLDADPPTTPGVGITWHDEGVWAHNARNRALFGAWQLDAWNPLYVTPVFTGLEYASFSVFGVSLVSARLVSVVAGCTAVLLLGLGLRRSAGPLAGAAGAAVLATDYMSVMFSRAALLEALMTAFLVAAWWAYAASSRRAWLGVVAGICAALAFFTKASAAFFVAALALELALRLAGHWAPRLAPAAARWLPARFDPPGPQRTAVWWTALGACAAFGVAFAWFVWPNLEGYVFYNITLYGARRSFLSLGPIIDRASWFPVIHDFFTRNLLVTVLALAGTLTAARRWRTAHPGERLLLLWFVLGVVELLAHDLGNERRFVFLLPAMAGLAAVVLGRVRRGVPRGIARWPRSRAWLGLPIIAYASYILVAAIVRVPFVYEIRTPVRVSAAAAALLAVVVAATWPRVPRWLADRRWSVRHAGVLLALVVAGNLALYAQWAASRTYANVAAMRAVAAWLPAGTLVQGKLANGLSLESRIRPLYIGVGFGNYADRFTRPDVRYVMTYTRPWLGYDSPASADLLAHLPGWTVVATAPVAESFGGRDEMALIRKPGPPGGTRR